MLAEIMRRSCKAIIESLGYEVSKRNRRFSDPFALQKSLVAKEEPIIIDVGASDGRIAKKYKRYFPAAHIYCFEPFPEAFAELKRLAETDQRIYVFDKAVTNVVGSALLNSNKFSATNSLLSTSNKASLYWGDMIQTIEQLEVSTTTLDDFCLDNGISYVDILKVDVQGSEYDVLNGAKRLFSSQKIEIVYLELILCSSYNNQTKIQDYFAILDKYGYEWYDFYSIVRQQDRLAQFDCIFVPKK